MQIEPRAARGSGQRQSGDPEQQVHDVVQHRHHEQPEQFGHRVVAGEGHLAVMGRDAGEEAGDADEQEHRTDRSSDQLDRTPLGCAAAVGSAYIAPGAPIVMPFAALVPDLEADCRTVTAATGYTVAARGPTSANRRCRREDLRDNAL